MNMLTPHQIELIHNEADGANTPEASAEVTKLVETQPEALALLDTADPQRDSIGLEGVAENAGQADDYRLVN
jgi:hypothetical protein